jgi:Flp pilus assembly protein TadB
MDTMTSPRGQLRVSDADRDRAVAELSEHFQAGRLTQDELEDRTGQALRARTGQDLAALFTDLPRPKPPAAGQAISGQRRPVEPYRAPFPRVAVVACVIAVAIVVSSGVHYAVFGLAPVIVLLVVARCLSRRRVWDQRSR